MPLNLNLISYLKGHRLDWKNLEQEHNNRLITGMGPQFMRVLKGLPDAEVSEINLDQSKIEVGKSEDLSQEDKDKLLQALVKLKPWRKGPFDLFGIDVDTEWDSSLKWDRIHQYLDPLTNKRILDVGCNSGYYMLRMLAEDPRYILGVDPSAQYYAQFQLLQHYIQDQRMQFLAVGYEDILGIHQEFDALFCMGILYHRKNPYDFLKQMRQMMRKDGQLVLETLTIEGEGDICLSPKERYAKMRNVYLVPTASCLANWVNRAGFKEIKFADHTYTTLDEQRKTDWMDSESLDSFLDPKDHSKTIEGYPAPRRTLLLARA